MTARAPTARFINAYTHGALAATLFKAEDELRVASKYSGAFLVSHINGGVAGIAKTKAIDTIESGPILGILGSAHLAKSYGLNDVVAMDVGGTTAKISVLRNGEPIYRKPSDLFGNPIEVLASISAFHRSRWRKRRQAGSRRALGLRSTRTRKAGDSSPGPACYALGGDEATLTDAFVAAGLIDPEYFLGGSKPIDLDLARKTIEELVAQPLHISLDAACKIIIDHAFTAVAHMIAGAQQELGAELSSHTLFAYGGNGGLFGAGVAASAGIQRVLVFSLGPVFSAFGSSVSDICHVYERPLSEAAITEAGMSRIRGAFDEIKAECAKDLLGEGIRPQGLRITRSNLKRLAMGEQCCCRARNRISAVKQNFSPRLPPRSATELRPMLTGFLSNCFASARRSRSPSRSSPSAHEWDPIHLTREPGLAKSHGAAPTEKRRFFAGNYCSPGIAFPAAP